MGGIQIIDTEVDMLELALADNNSVFHLLSDSDFLCRPLSELLDYFDEEKNRQYQYMEVAPAEEVWKVERVKIRFYTWNIHDVIDTRKYHLGLVNRYLGNIQWFLHFRRGKFPYSRLYGGSSWWTVNRDGAELLYYEMRDKHKYDRFRFTYAPDEIFPATIIGNSQLKVRNEFCLRNRDYRNAGLACFRYIPWWKPGSRTIHPLTLDNSDYPLIKKSKAFFCRKMNGKDATNLIVQFDNEIY